MCPHTPTMCPHTTAMCPHTLYTTLLMCSHTTMCPHTTVYLAFSYYYICVSYYYTCLHILLYLCPHTTIYVSSHYCINGLILDTQVRMYVMPSSMQGQLQILMMASVRVGGGGHALGGGGGHAMRCYHTRELSFSTEVPLRFTTMRP